MDPRPDRSRSLTALGRTVRRDAEMRRCEVARYEYATVPLISHALQQILNQWGEDGWELVTVVENVAYFKRVKADA